MHMPLLYLSNILCTHYITMTVLISAVVVDHVHIISYYVGHCSISIWSGSKQPGSPRLPDRHLSHVIHSASINSRTHFHSASDNNYCPVDAFWTRH